MERQLSVSALDLSLHVCGSVNDTFAENELERERRVPLRACARDDVEPWNLQELFLERRGDVVRHGRRIRARIGAGDLDNRVIDRGQIVDRELAVGGDTSD